MVITAQSAVRTEATVRNGKLSPDMGVDVDGKAVAIRYARIFERPDAVATVTARLRLADHEELLRRELSLARSLG